MQEKILTIAVVQTVIVDMLNGNFAFAFSPISVFFFFFFFFFLHFTGKVQVGNDQEKVQSERNSHSKNRGGKNKLTIRYLYLENISFPKGGHSSVTRT